MESLKNIASFVVVGWFCCFFAFFFFLFLEGWCRSMEAPAQIAARKLFREDPFSLC